MAVSRTLQILILAKDLASRSLRGIGRSLRTFRSGLASARSAVFSLQGAVVSLAATIGATVLGRSFLSAAVTAERYRMQLKILTGSQKEANDLFEQGADLAASIAYEYEDVMGTIVAMRGVIKGGSEEVMKWTRLIADVAAAVGMDIMTTTQQITRMYSAGAQAAELFKERGKLAMLGFTTGVSYTVKETRERLMRLWQDPLSSIKGAAAMMANTWEGMMSMMADSWFQFRQLVMEKGGVFDYIKATAKMWLDFIGELKSKGELETWALSMGSTVIRVLGGIAQAAAWVGDAFRGWIMIWDGIKKAVAVMGILVSDTMMFIITCIRKVFDAYKWILEMQKKIAESVVVMGQKLQQAAKDIPTVGKRISEVAKGIANMGKAFAVDTQAGIDTMDEWDEKLGGINDLYRQANDEMFEIIANTQEHLLLLAAEVPYHEKVEALLKKINEQAEIYRKKREEIAEDEDGEKPPEFKAPPKAKVVISAELARFKADAKLASAFLDKLYKENAINAERYYEVRRSMIEQGYQAEIDAQEKLLKQEEIAIDPNKRLQIETKVYVLRKQLRLELLKINEQERKDSEQRIREAKEAARIIEDITRRAATIGEFGLASQFAEEARDLQNRQREEMDRLNELHKKGLATRAQIEEAHRQQQIERDRLATDQRIRLVDEYLFQAKQALGFMEQAFGDAYEASGKKIKEFFYLQKAASIASTIISTYEAAQDAYKAMVDIPYVGPALAVAAAAMAITAGLARVNMIRKQEMAAGGKVKGRSPHSKADNIDIKATAGEYMQPVSAVKHYGLRAMDAIKTMSIPREVLQGWAGSLRAGIAAIRRPANAAGYADGGSIQAGQSSTTLSATTNVTLPESLNFLKDRLRTEIEDTVIGVLKEELSY